MSKWIASLPEVPLKDAGVHAGFAVADLGVALAIDANSVQSMNASPPLWFVQRAAAHVRAWRKALPKEWQDERCPEDALQVFRDVRTDLLDALLGIYHASLYANVGHNLREAEAFLRRAGTWLMEHPDE